MLLPDLEHLKDFVMGAGSEDASRIGWTEQIIRIRWIRQMGRHGQIGWIEPNWTDYGLSGIDRWDGMGGLEGLDGLDGLGRTDGLGELARVGALKKLGRLDWTDWADWRTEVETGGRSQERGDGRYEAGWEMGDGSREWETGAKRQKM